MNKSKTILKLRSIQSALYKALLLCISVATIVYVIPTGGYFKYEFQKGKPWLYDDLIAPFDFAILRLEKDIEAERKQAEDQQRPYFSINDTASQQIIAGFKTYIEKQELSESLDTVITAYGVTLLQRITNQGIRRRADKSLQTTTSRDDIILIRSNVGANRQFSSILDTYQVLDTLHQLVEQSAYRKYTALLDDAFFSSIAPNVSYNKILTERDRRERLSKIPTSSGFITKDSRIISKGETVEGEKYRILYTLNNIYESDTIDADNKYWTMLGYAFIVAVILFGLGTYIYLYYPQVFRSTSQLTFIMINLLGITLVNLFVVRYNNLYVYAVPVCIVPLIIRSFMHARLALYTFIFSVLPVGLVVADSYHYILIQISAGLVTMRTARYFHHRAQLFLAILYITLMYTLMYVSIGLVSEGGFEKINYLPLVYIGINGLLMLFSQPLIYLSEKIFGFTSDISLFELADTDNPLLKDMANHAGGTFQHSLQVANISEAAVDAIGGNALLVKVAALYHDIGKLKQPIYFTENQFQIQNPHNKLEPKQSVDIIIDHVQEGITRAKKHKLPEVLIDFIESHHGNTLVQYFYHKAKEIDPDTDPAYYRYPHPKPSTREMVVLMMVDSCEAASKSLKQPNVETIDTLVENIVAHQFQEGQYDNANITLQQITTIKHVIKERLKSIYQLREAYPE